MRMNIKCVCANSYTHYVSVCMCAWVTNTTTCHTHIVDKSVLFSFFCFMKLVFHCIPSYQRYRRRCCCRCCCYSRRHTQLHRCVHCVASPHSRNINIWQNKSEKQERRDKKKHTIDWNMLIGTMELCMWVWVWIWVWEFVKVFAFVCLLLDLSCFLCFIFFTCVCVYVLDVMMKNRFWMRVCFIETMLKFPKYK